MAAMSATRGSGVPPRARLEVSQSAFAFLFSELVQYAQSRALSVADIERQLEEAGIGLGLKLLELQCLREKQVKSGPPAHHPPAPIRPVIQALTPTRGARGRVRASARRGASR